MLDAGRILRVIDAQIDKKIGSSSGIDVTYGQVFGITSEGVSGLEASVYLAGAIELAASTGEPAVPSEGFRIPTHLKVSASDYVMVAMDRRGHRWIEEVFTEQTYTSSSHISTIWKPVMASAPNLITTDGGPIFVPLTTVEGDAIMAETPR